MNRTFASIGLISLLVFGCNKDKPSPMDGETTVSQNDSTPRENSRSNEAQPIESHATAVNPTDGSATHPGKALAEEHCKRCHLVPEPADLPADRWDFAIAWMAHYFGHGSFTGPQRSVVLEELVQQEPIVERKVLETILDYYETSAPDEVASDKIFPTELSMTPQFQARPDLQFLPDARTVTCVKIDSKNRRIFVGDAQQKKLWEFSPAATPLARHDCLNTQPISVRVRPDGFEATLIGHFLEAGDAGKIMRATATPAGTDYNQPIPDFFRLAHSHRADVDGDGFDDYLLSGFGGRFLGAFSIFWGQSDDKFLRQDLISRNGPISSATLDVDSDGDLDILMLSAQGWHEFMLYKNEGNRKFTNKLIWKNRPSFGANGFRMIDLDGDDRDELVLFCGNNMELGNPPIRPHHGIYVYRHRGNARFKQVFFYPLPATVAIASGDFDGDDDVDLAAVSSLPDWRVADPVSTVILTNNGKLDFSATTIAGTEGMQWTSLDAADADGDGDIDLAMGMLNFVPALESNQVENFNNRSGDQPSVLFVENLSK